MKQKLTKLKEKQLYNNSWRFQNLTHNKRFKQSDNKPIRYINKAHILLKYTRDIFQIDDMLGHKLSLDIFKSRYTKPRF